MANFNKVKPRGPRENSYEGGAVYKKTVVDEWLNMLFSSFLEDQFYETGKDQQKRFIELTQKMCEAYGPVFVSKAAFFARNILGMRSISQLTAAWLNTQNFETKRIFYKTFMHRPDDVAEIFAAIDYLGEKRSHALIRGSADYLSTLRPQTLAKYKLHSRTYNMFDLINITHATSPAINDYKNNVLEYADTWEVKIAGAKDKVDRDKEWRRLVEGHKLGYMALIRNLNNILEACNFYEGWIEEYLVPQITDEKAIRKSLMFPYRFYTAYKNLKVNNFELNAALGKAFKIAAKYNAPQLAGPSAILLDVSGSMSDSISSRSNIMLKEVGACFAVSLLIANPNCITIKFGTDSKLFKFNLLDNPFINIERLCANENCGYGTEVGPAFSLLSFKQTAKQNVKRIFLISDMQVMDGHGWYGNAAVSIYNQYFRNTPCYSFDLGNYGTQVLPPRNNNLHFITALNDQVFKFIGLLEGGIDLVDYINSINYC